MRYLFNDWNRLSSKIQNSPHVFLFLDYDGTLTPIVKRPEYAKFPRSVKISISKLKKDPRFMIAIISGRSLKNVKNMVGIKGIIYAGNHGLEIEGKGIRFSRPSAAGIARPIVKKIGAQLRKDMKNIKGVFIEDKGATLSLHYRLARSKDKTLIKKKLDKITRPYIISKKIKVTSGKKVWEVRPNLDWNKGRAVNWHLKKKKTFPLYIGDDVTDIDAFRAIRKKGVSVFVGKPKKGIGSDYFLSNTREVGKFLKKLTTLPLA